MLGEQRNDEDIDLDEDSAPNENTDLNANDVTIPTSIYFYLLHCILLHNLATTLVN